MSTLHEYREKVEGRRREWGGGVEGRGQGAGLTGGRRRRGGGGGGGGRGRGLGEDRGWGESGDNWHVNRNSGVDGSCTIAYAFTIIHQQNGSKPSSRLSSLESLFHKPSPVDHVPKP